MSLIGDPLNMAAPHLFTNLLLARTGLPLSRPVPVHLWRGVTSPDADLERAALDAVSLPQPHGSPARALRALRLG